MLKGKILPLSDSIIEHLRSASAFSKNEKAQFRLKTIEFSKKYGIQAAVDAFDVSRVTIYRLEKDAKTKLMQLILIQDFSSLMHLNERIVKIH